MYIKERFRNNYLGQLAISLYHCYMGWIMPKLMSDEKAVKKYYRKKSGGIELDLNNPRKFSEKQQWYKLHSRQALMQKCADKLAVRDYIIERGYENTLNELLGVYDRAQDIDYSQLPDRFVLKATHGSSMNYIVKNKALFDKKRAGKMMNSWLHQNIAWSGREWVYMNMPRHIIAEAYLEDETGELQDYKFFCFNGEPKFLQVTGGRFSNSKYQNFYDLEWNLLPFGKDLASNPNVIVPRPDQFNFMIKMAHDLCNPFQFVRVDLYQANGKVYFGEMTFFPAGGAPDFKPSEYDQIVGDMWQLVDFPNEDFNEHG